MEPVSREMRINPASLAENEQNDQEKRDTAVANEEINGSATPNVDLTQDRLKALELLTNLPELKEENDIVDRLCRSHVAAHLMGDDPDVKKAALKAVHFTANDLWLACLDVNDDDAQWVEAVKKAAVLLAPFKFSFPEDGELIKSYALDRSVKLKTDVGEGWDIFSQIMIGDPVRLMIARGMWQALDTAEGWEKRFIEQVARPLWKLMCNAKQPVILGQLIVEDGAFYGDLARDVGNTLLDDATDFDHDVSTVISGIIKGVEDKAVKHRALNHWLDEVGKRSHFNPKYPPIGNAGNSFWNSVIKAVKKGGLVLTAEEKSKMLQIMEKPLEEYSEWHQKHREFVLGKRKFHDTVRYVRPSRMDKLQQFVFLSQEDKQRFLDTKRVCLYNLIRMETEAYPKVQKITDVCERRSFTSDILDLYLELLALRERAMENGEGHQMLVATSQILNLFRALKQQQEGAKEDFLKAFEEKIKPILGDSLLDHAIKGGFQAI